MSGLDDVYSQAGALGLVVDGPLRLDGEWHRVCVVGKGKHNLAGAYCLSELRLKSGAAVVVGMLYNWRTREEVRRTLEGVDNVSLEDMREASRLAAAAVEKSKQAKAQLQDETAARALGIWDKLPDSGASPYLDKKGVRAWGVRFSRGSVVVPLRDAEGKLWSLQFINADGEKRFLTGGAKRGRFHLIQGVAPGGDTPFSVIGVAEGYATASSIFEVSNIPVAVAFDAGNLLPVAQALSGVYPNSRIILFADDDRHGGYPQAFIRARDVTDDVRALGERVRRLRPDMAVEFVADDDPRLRDSERSYNVGVASAVLAAAAVGGDVVFPSFEGAAA